MSQHKFFKDPSLISGYGKDSPVLLGLSGGADSSALLHLLCEYASNTGAKIFAAHLNHGIRTEAYGNEAERDENFCRELCRRLGVELFVKKLDIPGMAEASGRSVETEARKARYDFFSEIMKEQNIKILATAHNADDNLETQIYNIARGCGIDGLVGIPEARPLDSVDGGIVIRPILSAEKREILEYCKENSIPYVTDSTNREDEYVRNAIRHKAIPILKEMFPHLIRSSERLSISASEDADFILTAAQDIVAKNGESISTEYLSSLHPSVAKRVVKLMYSRLSDATLEYVHISNVLSLPKANKNGAAISLPDKISARVVDGKLCFEAVSEECDEQKTAAYRRTLRHGFNKIEGTCFAVSLSDEKPHNDIDGYTLYSSAKIKAEYASCLCAENRRSGMTVTDGGINKKIKKLMCDKKVPLYDRGTLPLVLSGDEIIYAPLCAVCDKAKTRSGEKLIFIGIYKIIGG